MCESLPASFDDLLEHLKANGGHIVLSYDAQKWVIGYEFGKEEPDNPENKMVGGAAYGLGPDLDSALGDVVEQVGIRGRESG